jgi:hypothetical protein
MASWIAADISDRDRGDLKIVGFLMTLTSAWVTIESFWSFDDIFIFTGLDIDINI